MSWFRDAFVYHLYPLGALGAPTRNDFVSPPVDRLSRLHEWLDSAAELGADTFYLGPVFESSTHGYDTADFYQVDRRLGDTAGLAAWSEALHRRGMRLLLDGVFHHVGRDFWAFRDVLATPDTSRFRAWFHIDPAGRSPYGDPFTYECWNGHHELVKLSVHHPEVKSHLFEAVRRWVQELDIDGLRLDAADLLDLDFQAELAGFCRSLRPDFCLLGEVIHGDYRRWVGPGRLDSVTNYEVYKGLYSSHNDRNYFEIAHSLGRQFGPRGLYAELPLCAFADNHDVDRIASRLDRPVEIYPLHILLFTMPGVPAIYYGSEWGVAGRKGRSDAALRPTLSPREAAERGEHPELRSAIQRLAALRRAQPALRRGSYRELAVNHQQLAFERATGDPGETIVVVVNAAERATEIRLHLREMPSGRLIDLLEPDSAARHTVSIESGLVVIPVPPRWGRILAVISD